MHSRRPAVFVALQRWGAQRTLAIRHELDRSRTRALVLALVVLAVLWGPGSLAAKVFDPQTFTLDNGLQVVVVTNRRAPIVTHMVWYKVGAADEAPGESGNAHFLEHLMFKGTRTLGPGEFSKIIARNGGRENAFTSHDYTAYYQMVARDRLDIVMKYEADRMANLVLTDEVVLPERDVVLEERRSRVSNDPGAKLAEMVNATLYLNHPYRLPVIGWEHEIKALNTETALAFYRRWYAPNNAILIVAGDVTAEEVRPLAEKYYGVIPAHPVPARVRPQEPPQFAPRRVTLESARVRQPSVSILYLAPSYHSDRVGTDESGGNRAYALQVLDEIMGGGTTSRLYRRLVVEQGIAAAAGSAYDAHSFDLTTFRFYVSPRPGGDLDAAEAALRAEIVRLLKDGVSDEEVVAARRRLVAQAVYARDSLSTAPNVFGRALTTGSTVADVEAWPERIQAVSAAEVNAAARAVLRDVQSVTGVLRPKPTS
ncbi:MAG: insulinase family protein [Alphaproteobacteria bacterium]|nr:MAG: insulinase family protein [Alphaproteobacteria bacterium]